jgi:hypothetical protein
MFFWRDVKSFVFLNAVGADHHSVPHIFLRPARFAAVVAQSDARPKLALFYHRYSYTHHTERIRCGRY